MPPEKIANLDDPARANATLVGDASDEELLRALQRAEAKIEPPSDAKMEELAARLGPIVAPQRGASSARRWLVVAAMAGLALSGAALFRSRLETPPTRAPAAELPTPAPPLPQATTALGPESAPPPPTDPVVAVESAPAPSASVITRRPRVESACASEIELVDRADAALRAGDPAGALDLARQHAERCPSGVYAQERERLAIEALARLGRTSELRARAASFEARFPSSPHLRRIRSLLEGEPR